MSDTNTKASNTENASFWQLDRNWMLGGTAKEIDCGVTPASLAEWQKWSAVKTQPLHQTTVECATNISCACLVSDEIEWKTCSCRQCRHVKYCQIESSRKPDLKHSLLNWMPLSEACTAAQVAGCPHPRHRISADFVKAPNKLTVPGFRSSDSQWSQRKSHVWRVVSNLTVSLNASCLFFVCAWKWKWSPKNTEPCLHRIA